MALIEREALSEHKFPEEQCNGLGEAPAYRQGWNDAIDAIVEDAPAVDAVPVVHGHWYDIGSLSCRCSECGCKSDKESAYCPTCGAKMDGKDEEHGRPD